jgi:hypothetical protein
VLSVPLQWFRGSPSRTTPRSQCFDALTTSTKTFALKSEGLDRTSVGLQFDKVQHHVAAAGNRRQQSSSAIGIDVADGKTLVVE